VIIERLQPASLDGLVMCACTPGVERFTLRGETVESLAYYDNGDFVGREQIDIENREDVEQLKRGTLLLMTGYRFRKITYLALG
jgi:hypothetical protein